MSSITVLCRCHRRRTVLVIDGADGYRFPSIEMMPFEARRTAFDRFVADEFVMDSEAFEPDFRSMGSDIGQGIPWHFVLCSVHNHVMPMSGHGQYRAFRWIGRLDFQYPEKFSEGARRILDDDVVRNLLFRFRYSDLLAPE